MRIDLGGQRARPVTGNPQRLRAGQPVHGHSWHSRPEQARRVPGTRCGRGVVVVLDGLGSGLRRRLAVEPVPVGSEARPWTLQIACRFSRSRGRGAGANRRRSTVPQRQPHVIVKSANCGFSLEWIARRYAPRVVSAAQSAEHRLQLDGTQHRARPARRSRRSAPMALAARARRPARGLRRELPRSHGRSGCSRSRSKRLRSDTPTGSSISHDDLSNDPYEGFTVALRSARVCRGRRGSRRTSRLPMTRHSS